MADTKTQETLDSIASRIVGPQPEKVTFGQVFSAQRRDERFGHAAIDQLFNGRELARQDEEETRALGGWDSDAEVRKAISGLDPDDAAFLVENGRRGPASMRKAQARLMLRKDTDRLVSQAGGTLGTFASVAADLTNPVAAAAGMLGGYAVMGGRAMLTARAGSVAARTGVPGARSAALTRIGDEVVGGVAGSLAYSGVQDTLGGQVMDIGDYALDAAADAAGTVALFGAAKGATWAVRRLAGVAHVPGAPNTAQALREAGLEPPFDPKTAPAGEEVARKAVAEAESPRNAPDDGLFDDDYKKALTGDTPAETPAGVETPSTLAYHGSPDGTGFLAARGLGTHFAKSADTARHFATPDGRVYAARLTVNKPLLVRDHGGTHTDATGAVQAIVDAGGLPKDYMNEGFYARLTEGLEGLSPEARAAKYTENNLLELERVKAALEQQGYDGLLYQNAVREEGAGEVLVAFRTEQIRLDEPTPEADAEGIAFPVIEAPPERTAWAPTGGPVTGATDDPTKSLSWKADGQPLSTHDSNWEAIARGDIGAGILSLGSGKLPVLPNGGGKVDTSDPFQVAAAADYAGGFFKRLLGSKPVGRVATAVHPEAGAEGMRESATYQQVLRGLMAKFIPNGPPVYLAVTPVVAKNVNVRGAAYGASQGHLVVMRSGLGDTAGTRTLVHEFGHVLTYEYGKFLTDTEFSKLRDAYRAFVNSQDPTERALFRYAPGNASLTTKEGAALAGAPKTDAEAAAYFDSMAEFAAEQFVKFVQKNPEASGIPDRLLKGIKDMVRVVVRLFSETQYQRLLDPEEAFEDFFQGILDGKFAGRTARRGPESLNPELGPQGEFSLDPASASTKAAGKVVGSARAQATDRMRKGLYDRAVSLMSRQPIRTERLRTMNKHLGGGLSDGLILAGAENPGIQMLATRLSETTTGAAGRGNTAAVLARITEEKIAGNVLRVYTSAWHEWASANGVSWVKRFGANEQRTRFDQAVQAELYRRRSSKDEVLPEFDPVRRAADALDAAHTRAADEGRAAGILGAANLPEGGSRGYWTQRLDGRRIIEATPEERAALQEGLTGHFQQAYTLEPRVAAAVADVYVRNAVAKIHGTGTVQVDVQGSVVRSIREEMEHIADGIEDPVLKQELLESTQGMSNTRKRLDIPWDNEAVRKFFDSDLIGLNRGYNRRMAAEVGTTRVGLLGLKGVRELRAASLSNGPMVTDRELQALDRIIAELFGTPVPGAVTSIAAQNARSLTASVRLGGAVWSQAADMMNVAAALGVTAAFRSIPRLPSLVLDIRRMVAGGETTGILQGVDRAGGKLGLRSYLIEAPLAPSDDMLTEYTRTPGIFTQLTRHVGYASQSINFFRAFLAVQHRHTAEELLKHVVDAHLAGRKLSTPVRDMGFTDELVQGLGPAIKRGRDGTLLGFDPALLDEKAAQQFMVSLHRGVAQMIQSNFVGENSSWAHNDWVKIMTQFRTFSLTANEKQIARRRANAAEDGGMADGYAHVMGHLAAQMAVGATLYLGRVQVSLIGLEEAERAKRAKQALAWPAVTQGALNASTLSGFTGDALSALSALKGWLPEDVQDAAGLRGGRPGSLPGTIPVIGMADQIGRTIQDPSVRKVAKLVPGANAPLVLPFVNMLPN